MQERWKSIANERCNSIANTLELRLPCTNHRYIIIETAEWHNWMKYDMYIPYIYIYIYIPYTSYTCTIYLKQKHFLDIMSTILGPWWLHQRDVSFSRELQFIIRVTVAVKICSWKCYFRCLFTWLWLGSNEENKDQNNFRMGRWIFSFQYSYRQDIHYS